MKQHVYFLSFFFYSFFAGFRTRVAPSVHRPLAAGDAAFVVMVSVEGAAENGSHLPPLGGLILQQSQLTVSRQVRASRAAETYVRACVRTYVRLGAGRQASSALHQRGLLPRLQGEGARQLPGQLLQRTFISSQGRRRASSPASDIKPHHLSAGFRCP